MKPRLPRFTAMDWQALVFTLLLVAAARVFAVESYPAAQWAWLSPVECVRDAGRFRAQFEAAPADATQYFVRHMGDPGSLELAGQIARPIATDVSALTGFRPPEPLSNWQRGYADGSNAAVGNVFQMHCESAGFLIDTRRFPHTQPVTGGGPHIAYGRRFQPGRTVWRDDSSELTLQAQLALPTLDVSGNAEVQVNFVYYVQDTVTQTVLAHVIGLYSTRPASSADAELLSHDSFHAFAGSPLTDALGNGARPRYVMRSPFSEPIRRGETWSEPRFFRAHVGSAQLANLVGDLAAREGIVLSTDASRWRVIETAVLVEVFPQAGEARVGGSIRDFQVLEFFDP